MFLTILLVVLLILIFYQDLKYYAVSWVVFPILFAVLLYQSFSITGNLKTFLNTSFNLIILAIYFFSLSAYFSIRRLKLVNIFKSYLGFGDFLFLICLSTAFAPLNFMLFNVISFSFILIFIKVISWLNIYEFKKIPLAGLQSCIFCIMLILEQLHFQFNRF
jgi:hypothetical protein